MIDTTVNRAMDIMDEVKKVSSLIDTARRLLADQKVVDLAALQGKVETLCAAIKSAPPKQRRNLEAPLGAIIEELDLLATELTEQHEKVTSQIELSVRRQATKAYKSGNETS